MEEGEERGGGKGRRGGGKGEGEEGEEGEKGVEGERGGGRGRRGLPQSWYVHILQHCSLVNILHSKGEPHLILQRELLHFLLRVADTNKSTWSEYLTFALCFPLFQFLPLVLPAGADQVDGRGRAEEPARK